MGDLVATRLRPTDLAEAAPRLWDEGHAVLPLDPGAPPTVIRQITAALRPTHILDADGLQSLPDGVPVDDDVVAVVATSGTTGSERAVGDSEAEAAGDWTGKGVELTRSGMEDGARAYCEALGADSSDRWLGCLPMHHVAGLAVIPRSRFTGIPLTVLDRFDIGAVARAPSIHGASLVLLVPTMLHRLLDAGAALREYRWVLVGAGPLPAALRTRCADEQVRVLNTYGMTEAWGGVAFDGVPIGGIDVTVAADGEILVRGPLLMKGYRLRPDLTAAAFDDDGWYHTGDIGELNGGRLTVTDRRVDIVKSGGVSVSPTAVEHVLAQHSGVKDVVVVGRDDPEWGERVVACVVPVDPASPPTLDDLRAFARDHLTASHLPREVQIVAEIPRSASGKAQRRAIRATLHDSKRSISGSP